MTSGRIAPTTALLTLSLLAAGGCSPPENAPSPEEGDEVEDEPGEETESGSIMATPLDAEAEMVDSSGAGVGKIRFQALADRHVRLEGSLHLPDLEPGPKGLHVHQEGRCDPPDFESAGGHFDPHGAPHGGLHDPPDERHVGDLGNVEATPEGRIRVAITDAVLSLQEGHAENVRNRSLILHEGEDDLSTDPDGDAGDRVACGVIR